MIEARGASVGHRLHHNRPSIQPSESQGTRTYANNRPLYTQQISRHITHAHTRNHSFLFEGNRARSHRRASPPHTPIASQSYQRTPTQPPPLRLGWPAGPPLPRCPPAPTPLHQRHAQQPPPRTEYPPPSRQCWEVCARGAPNVF